MIFSWVIDYFIFVRETPILLLRIPTVRNRLSLQFVSVAVAKQHDVMSRHQTGMVTLCLFIHICQRVT